MTLSIRFNVMNRCALGRTSKKAALLQKVYFSMTSFQCTVLPIVLQGASNIISPDRVLRILEGDEAHVSGACLRFSQVD
jgi:hypothetical protein